ncbi:MAG: bifunctional [glutamate--ammonia ligase]-adenylyl-L-tyrosine phosphorylase/[glutamate--ammonia-ligase] adenylyltransferase [Burkholderiaceae bacterium]
MNEELDPAYQAALAHSAFARRLLPQLRDKGFVYPTDAPITPALVARWAEEAIAQAHAHGQPADQALRQFRNRALLAMMGRDLAGLADLEENLSGLSALAEHCIQWAYQTALQESIERHGQPLDRNGQPVDLMVVGMGKLGGCELNASSDIDLIYLIREDGETTGHDTGRGKTDLFSFFARVGRRMAVLLEEPTADGFAFRVDLRLRPNGDSGPMICSLAMLEDYFVVQGREWERYAWVKARVVNQPIAQDAMGFQRDIESLEALRRPFVYRRYLDFSAISALRDLHRQIREEALRRSLKRESRLAGTRDPIDIKLGPGGIREIEFIAQVFQLIRGGREESLRARGTREVLATLSRQGRLEANEAQDLQDAYAFWRRLEHRLQYDEDQQTHVLPGDTDCFERMARSMGLQSAETLAEGIGHHQSTVAVAFERLFHRDNEAAASDPEAGNQRPTDRESRLSRVKAMALRHAQATSRPEQVERLLGGLIDEISGRSAYLALFDEYPDSMGQLARIAEVSEWAMHYLRRHPIVLDELLDRRSRQASIDLAQFESDLRRELAVTRIGDEPDVERQMDLLREAHHAQLFRILVQDLDGRWTVEALADQLSELADRMLQVTLEVAWRATKKRHRPDPAFAIIAYGKLGGKELGYASDLDLIFIHDDPDPDAPERYARLAQRINVWLTTQTAAGSLFEIDLRLRPNGNAGLLVTSLSGFIRYQESQAWTWEHQALTRARFCAGDPQIGAAFEAERVRLLCLPRTPALLLEEICSMRQKMHEGHPNDSDQFDLKHDAGGMVDIEFIVQALVLEHAHTHPELTGNLGNIALLKSAGRLGLIPESLAEAVSNAYRVFRLRQHRLRLAGSNKARTSASEFSASIQAVRALWAHVFDGVPQTPRALQLLHEARMSRTNP